MPGVATIAQESDIEVYEGDDLDLFVWEEDEDTGAITNVTGCTARMRAAYTQKDSDDTELFDISVGAGITVQTRTIEGVSTKGLAIHVAGSAMLRGAYTYDLKVTVSGGGPSTWDAGTLIVKRARAFGP